MRYGYFQWEFLILGPQMGPQINFFENYIMSVFTGTKNQNRISHGCDLNLKQIFMLENVVFSMISNDL